MEIDATTPTSVEPVNDIATAPSQGSAMRVGGGSSAMSGSAAYAATILASAPIPSRWSTAPPMA